MFSYYGYFMPQYAYIATPLYNCLQKNTKFDWTKNYDTVLKQFKYALVHAPVLAIPNFDTNFVVETDASDIAICAVLIQHDQSVALISKALSSAQCNYHTMYCKLLAVVIACKKWHPYLDGKKTKVVTVYKPLRGTYTAPYLNKR